MNIEIKALKAQVMLGVYEWEQQQARPVTMDILLEVDNAAAGLSDDLADTLDYAALAELMIERAQHKPWQLIEAMIHEMLDAIGQHDKVITAEIAVSKPGAVRQAETVIVSDRRRYR